MGLSDVSLMETSPPESFLNRLETTLANGTYGKPKKKQYTFGEWAENWLKGKEKSLKPSTWASYEQTFRTHIFPYFENEHISDIKPRDVQSWVNELSSTRLAPASVARCYRCLRACLKQAESWGDIDKCPCRSISLPRSDRKELDFLQPEEVGQLLQATSEPERTLFAMLAFSGLRLGEALGLSWKHVNFKDNTLIVERAWSAYGGFQEPKTQTSRRAVPIMPNLAVRLQEHYEAEGCPTPDALVFTFGGARPLDPGNARRELYKALDRAGLKHVSLHSLRHTFASILLASGASIKALQRSLGHANASMTLNTYSHLIPEDLGNALLRADLLVTGADGSVVRLSTASLSTTASD